MSMRKKMEELERRRSQARKMGGEARLSRQKERGKLDARARLDLLLDPKTFREIGLLATHLGKLDSPTPADGVVCGTGFIESRPVCVASYDFTVLGGSIGPVGERKVAPARAGATRAHSDDLARRFRGRAPFRRSGGGGLDHFLRRYGLSLSRTGGDERSRSAGGGDGRSGRCGHRLHSGTRGFRPHGSGHVLA